MAGQISPLAAGRLSVALFLVLLLGTCSPRVSLLLQVKKGGELRVVTLNSGTTYYLASYGPTGFEYELAKQFAQRLGVKLKIIVADSPQEAIDIVRSGGAHIAAGLTATPSRIGLVRFGPTLMNSTPQLVYRVGHPKPGSLESLDAPIQVVAGSGEVERLQELKANYPALRWQETDESDSEGLLYDVAEGDIPYTVADSRVVTTNSRYYPQLRVAMDLGTPVPVAWAFSKGVDEAFYNTAAQFLMEEKKDDELARLIDTNFQYTTDSGYVGGQLFAQQVQTKLPEYRKAFEQAATDLNIDWRLLAAIGYQESHWNPDAVSPTGVRGLMMLTEGTADLMKVNRLDSHDSILGGARYLREMYNLLPDSIKEPDRTWMALASYNVGYGHLFDARHITELRKGNPDHWGDVRQGLLLLSQERWNKQTKYGYARGAEPVAYVSNIRNYYDILVWLTSGENLPPPEALTQKALETEPPPASKALEIQSPIL